MVHHSVAKRGCRNLARLAVVHDECPVTTWLVGTGKKLAMQCKHLGLEVAEKTGHVGPISFTPRSLVGRPEKVIQS
jgi:hypothetical protein